VSNAPKFSGSWVEQQIREAQERGDFDNLPGAGKPLKLRHPDDPDWFAKSLMEREDISGVLPGPLALRKERRQLPEIIDECSTEEQVREILTDFNARVRAQVLRDTTVVIGGVHVEEMVAEWKQRRGL
jgi:Domain of unknown function (DUF1992)